MGVGRVRELHRRIDILCIPYEQWGKLTMTQLTVGAALIYFTGNEIVSLS
jgi:hypothetical protein